MITHTSEHPGMSFYLARHGESYGNAGTLSQGRGEDSPDTPNGLTPKGKFQIEAAVFALSAAGIEVRYVSNSSLTRARESAVAFVNASLDPKPQLVGDVAPDQEDGLKEISQKGWEGIHHRERTKQLRTEKLQRFMGSLSLTDQLDQDDITGYAAWIMRLGNEGSDGGESPLGGALRGIVALEEHGVQPGELIFSHAMLNRYIDTIATTVDGNGRQELRHLLADQSLPESTRSVAVIRLLKEHGVKDFKTHDNAANRQANGGATSYIINPASGQWIAGRRIEPPLTGDEHAYREYTFNTKSKKWELATPDYK